MAKRYSSSTTNSLLLRWRRLNNKQQWLTLIGGVVLIWGSIYLVRAGIDTYKFRSLENTMTQLSQRIQDEFDVDEVVIDKYCAYSGRKYGKGPLGCNVVLMLNAGENDSEEIQSYAVHQEDLLYEKYNSPYTLNGDFLCDFSDIELSSGEVQITISCGGGAKVSHYPLTGE